MSEKDPMLRMFLIQETPKAFCVTGVAKPVDGVARTIWWIPASLVAYSKKTANVVAGADPHFEFTLPTWKLDKEQALWDFVKS